MSSFVTTPIPRIILPADRNFADGVVAGGPDLVFDWTPFGHTALRFVIINTGAGVLTVTPQAAYEAAGPAEVGAYAPAAFTVQPGDCYGDPYGIDEMRPFWRLWISGNSTFKWGVIGIPR